MARPKINIDASIVLKFAQLGCTVKEIAAHFGCTDDTIINRFSDELSKGRADLKMNLRQMQLKSAQNGNVTMQIWLGKQMLGQKDQHKIEADVEVTDNSEVQDLKLQIMGLFNVDSK